MADITDTTTTTTTTVAPTTSTTTTTTTIAIEKRSPYNDRFKAEQNRTKVLFKPDKYLQQSELNELQSIQSYYLGELGNIIAKDGDIQDGMNFAQESITNADGTISNASFITVKEGKVFLAGKVRSFSEQTVNITGSGLEAIGVRLAQSVITVDDDESLNDPTLGVPSYKSDGADRLHETVELVVGDSAAATIYQFNNGKLYKANVTTELSKITDIMAKRSFDTNGNYRVGQENKDVGFELSVTKDETDPDNLADVVIQGGTAFVQGYEIVKPYPTVIPVDKPTETETVTGEQYVYHPAQTDYYLRNSNVKSVSSVTAQVKRTFVINHAAQDGIDQIVGNLISIEKVYDTDPEKPYKEGTDYVISGNGISWAPPVGAEPLVNHSYKVDVTYNQQLTGKGVDYTVKTSEDGLQTYITFKDATGSGGVGAYLPMENGYITVTYVCYLFRVDTVTLDKNGTFTVHKGQPGRKDLAMPPSLNDPLTLEIGNVILYPNANSGEAVTSVVTNLTMEKLTKIVRRVENLEYNQVINSLDNQTIQEHSPEVLRGVFTDMFVTMDKYDENYDNTSTVTAGKGFKSNVMFSFEDGRITLPKEAEDPYQTNVNKDSSTAHVWGRLISASYKEVPVVSQLLATEFTLVNPYNFFQKEGVLKLDPSEDSWIDTTNIVINQTKTVSYNTGRWWRHKNNVSGGKTNDYYNKNTNWSEKLNFQKKLHGTLTETGQTTVDTQTQFMHVRELKFSATGLSPKDDNLVIRFNGIKCAITPASGYNVGSKEKGSIMADSKGQAAGSFKMPANVKCGKVPVVLQGAKSAATTSYVAEGINRKITDTIIKTYVTAHLTDPLAETFQTLDARQLTGVNLWFGSKDATAPVTVQIRGVSDTGFPNSTVYASQVLQPSEVNISEKATAVTKVRFDDPIMTQPGQQLAIVVIADSDDYTLATATMGHNRLDNGKMVNGQPYLEGVMFESSNASTWSPFQMMDMKFEVLAAEYNPSATIEFDPFTNMQIDEFVLFATYLTPDNTGCTWEYRMLTTDDAGTLDGKSWNPLANLDLTDAENIATQLQLRATFTANQYISPLMSLGDLQLGAFTTALAGDYVGITMDATDAPYNTITCTYVQNLPGKSSVKPQFSIDGGRSWNDFISKPTTKTVATGWTQIQYVETVTTNTSNITDINGGSSTTTTTTVKNPGKMLAKSFKMRLHLASPNPYQRPSVAQLSVAVTDE